MFFTVNYLVTGMLQGKFQLLKFNVKDEDADFPKEGSA